jgi:hypothetical protein
MIVQPTPDMVIVLIESEMVADRHVKAFVPTYLSEGHIRFPFSVDIFQQPL